VECFSPPRQGIEKEGKLINRLKSKVEQYFSSVMLRRLSDMGLIDGGLVNVRKVLMIFIKFAGEVRRKTPDELRSLGKKLHKIVENMKDSDNVIIALQGLGEFYGKWRSVDVLVMASRGT